MAANDPIQPDAGFLQETPDGGTEFTTAFRGGFGASATKPAQETMPGVQVADAGPVSAQEMLGPEPPEPITPDDLLGGRLDDDFRQAIEDRDAMRIEEMMLRDAERAGIPLVKPSSPFDFLFENNALFSPTTQAAGIDLAGSLRPKNIAAMTAGGVAKGLENTINLITSLGDWIDSTGFGVPISGGVQITDPKTGAFDPKLLSGAEYDAFRDQGGTSEVKVPGSGLEADTTSARLVQSFVQFLTGLGIVGKATGGVATGWNQADVVKRLGQYGLADLAAWDGQEGNLGNFIQSFPGLRNPVTEFLATDETTPEMEGRFKNALAGLPFNVITEPLLSFLKAVKEARRAKSLGASGDASVPGSVDVPQPAAVSQADVIVGTPDQELISVVESKIGQSPFADLGVPGHVTAKSLLPGSHKAPDIAPGSKRLMRVEKDGVVITDEVEDLAMLQAFIKSQGGEQGVTHHILYRDVPESAVPAPASKFSSDVKFNWSKVETDDDVKRLWGMMMDLQADQLRAQGVGRKISWKETAAKAGNRSAIEMLIGEGAKRGRALDADALEAAASINIKAMEDLKKLAEIAASPNATPEDFVAFDHMARVAVMAQNLFLPARSEAGRALNILRKVKQSSEQYGADLRLMLERMGGADTVQGKAQALVDLVRNNNDGGVSAAKATRDLMRARKLDVVREIWINNVFGLKTNMVNFAGNTLSFVQTVAERAVAGQLGKLDPVDGVAVGEATAMLRGALGAQREAFVMFGRAFRAAGTMDGDLFQGSGLDRLKFEVHPYSFSAEGLQVNGSAQGKAVDMLGTVMTQGRLWTRLMGGGDAYFKVINYRAQMRAEAWRKASHEVESGAIPAEKRMERFAEILASPTDGMKQSAGDFAAYNTFTNEPGPAVKKLMELRSAVSHIPGVGGFSYFVAPFIPTPANIWKFAFERTPLAPLSAKFKSDIAKGGAARDLALAKFGLGSMAMSVLYDMAMNGEITGSGPDANFAEKQTAGRLKEKPYSIRVEWGKKADGEPIYRYFAYNRLDPLGVMFGIAADIAEYARNSDKADDFQFEEAFYAAILAAGENLMNRSYTSGFSGLMDAIDNPQVYGEMYFQRLATSFIPTSVRDVTKALDPNMKHTHDMVSALKANLPYWSKDIPNRLNMWGEPISYRSGLGLLYDIMSPIVSASTEDQAPIDKEFRALEYYPPDTVSIMGDGSEEGDSDVRRIPLKNMPMVIFDFKTAAGATKASDLLDMEVKTPAGETLTLNEAMRERGGAYRSYANRLEQQGDKTMKETLNDLVTGKHELSPEYHAATVKEKKEMIGDIMRAYRGAARVMVMAKYPELQALRDKMYKRGQQYKSQFEAAPE
jgi:hypothetical protein